MKDAKLYAIEQADFERLLGPAVEILRRNNDHYDRWMRSNNMTPEPGRS